jgi:hypothetical protein
LPPLCRGQVGRFAASESTCRSDRTRRSDDKGENVKYWTSILAAAAIMAFGAPVAFGAGKQLPSDHEGVAHVAKGTVVDRSLTGSKVAPATELARVKAQNRKLTAKNRALAAKAKAAAAEAKWQADRNAAMAAWIGELNKRLATYEPQPQPAPEDPDKDCREYALCTPEQDCRINNNNCPVSQPAQPPVDEVKQDDPSTPQAELALETANVADSAVYQDC